MKYEWGHHGSELECPHVSVEHYPGQNPPEDIFDLRLYGEAGGDEQERAWFAESQAALNAMVELANIGAAVMQAGGDPLAEAITRVQSMRNAAETDRKRIVLVSLFYRGQSEDPLDSDPSDWSDQEVEGTFTDERYEEAVLAFNSDDYEAYDGQTGVIDAYDEVLAVLRVMRHEAVTA